MHRREPDSGSATGACGAMTPLWLVLGVGFVGGLVGLAAGLLSGNVLSSPRQLPFAVRGAIAVSTAILFGLVTWLFGASWELPAFCVFAAVAVVLGAVDLVERRLPNAVLYPGLIVMVVLLASTSWITGTWAAFLGALCCGAGLFALYFLLAVISPSGIGMGDVKLAALVGLALGYLGWMPLLVGGTAGFFIGGLTSLIALVSGRASRRSSLPFGPAMLAGAFLGMLVA